MLPAPVKDGSEELASIESLVAKGQIEKAHEAVSAALKLHPADARLFNVAGIVAAERGDLATAEAEFKRAVQLNPQLKSGWLNLGRVYMSGGQRTSNADNAIDAYRTALKLDPGNAEANHQLGLLLLLKGNFGQSLTHLGRLSPADQGRRAALILRCADEAALGRTEAALALAGRIAADKDLQEGDLMPVLSALAHNPRVEQRLLEGLVNSGRAGADSRRRLATLYEKEGQLAQARRSYESVAQADATPVDDLVHLAQIAWKQKDYEGVLGYLAHARDLRPQDAAIHFFFGVTCNEMRLPVEARKSLERALEIAPDNPYYNYAMGAVRLQWTDAQAAVPYLEKYLVARPDDPRGKLALAMAHFMAGEFGPARTAAEPLTSNSQAGVGAEFLLGRMAQKDGETEQAIVHFRRALAFDPRASEARAELAVLLFEKGDLEESRAETQAVLAADPKNYAANRTLLHLYQADRDSRVPQQLQRLQSLVQERENKLRLLERTIEVRPF